MKNIYLFLSERIRQERIKSGLTIEQLAEKAGISASFLACLVINKRKPSIETAAKIAKALNIPVSKLFEGISTNQTAGNDLKEHIFHIVATAKPHHQRIMLSTLKELLKSLNKNS